MKDAMFERAALKAEGILKRINQMLDEVEARLIYRIKSERKG